MAAILIITAIMDTTMAMAGTTGMVGMGIIKQRLNPSKSIFESRD
jgi:hypothetical protein